MVSLNLNKVKTQSKFKPAPAMEADTYMCRVVQVITVGKQAQRPFKGEAKPPKDEVQLTYEFCTEFLTKEDGSADESKPRWLSEFIPINSLDSDLAKLTKRYKAIDPRDESKGNLFDLVNKTCMVTVVKNPGQDGTERNYIAGVGPAPKGIPFPPLVNATRVFHVDDPDLEVFNDLPDWLKKKCTEENLRYAGSALEKALTGKSSVTYTETPAPAESVPEPQPEAPSASDDYDDDLPF